MSSRDNQAPLAHSIAGLPAPRHLSEHQDQALSQIPYRGDIHRLPAEHGIKLPNVLDELIGQPESHISRRRSISATRRSLNRARIP